MTVPPSVLPKVAPVKAAVNPDNDPPEPTPTGPRLVAMPLVRSMRYRLVVPATVRAAKQDPDCTAVLDAAARTPPWMSKPFAAVKPIVGPPAVSRTTPTRVVTPPFGLLWMYRLSVAEFRP